MQALRAKRRDWFNNVKVQFVGGGYFTACINLDTASAIGKKRSNTRRSNTKTTNTSIDMQGPMKLDMQLDMQLDMREGALDMREGAILVFSHV